MLPAAPALTGISTTDTIGGVEVGTRRTDNGVYPLIIFPPGWAYALLMSMAKRLDLPMLATQWSLQSMQIAYRVAQAPMHLGASPKNGHIRPTVTGRMTFIKELNALPTSDYAQ